MIYKYEGRDFKKLMNEFHRTRYGKTMFVICYALFFLLFVGIIFSFIMKLLDFEHLLYLILGCLISFLVGSYWFYKELRIFVNYKSKNQ